ncbi:DNA repair protein RecO [Testudinibacter aquarius]|uniref:DNA repair protein RecO n=1 Tax=Testudinibacter aquarius TaxID=1524974 RepID=A0ABY2XZP1_9PAST|nr:DNA repair protein RecO [Testudinibacter aquarius]TNG93418.1 DNA repair protein RecO [Testudinibacter aquarius]
MIEAWQRGFVLHRRPYNETSLLVDLFTEESGRLTVLAKGARAKRSALKSLLQPFTPLLLRWSGKGDLKILTKAEAISLALPLEHTALYSAFYINELVCRVIETEAPYPQLFQDYLHCLTALATCHINHAGNESAVHTSVEPFLRKFEFQLLHTLGYGVDFLHCAGSGLPIEPQMSYQYRAEQGFIASLLKNSQTFYGDELLIFASLAFDKLGAEQKHILQAAKRFTRMALKPYLGSQPLKSRELFQGILPGKMK